MNDYLSPQARKATQASELKRQAYWPKLARTTEKLVLTHPHRGGPRHKAQLVGYVKKALPKMRWDRQKGWWWVPLNATNLKEILDAFTLAKEVQLRLSDGVREIKSGLNHHDQAANTPAGGIL